MDAAVQSRRPRVDADRATDPHFTNCRAGRSPRVSQHPSADRQRAGSGSIPPRQVHQRRTLRLDAGRDLAALLRVLSLRLRHGAQGREDHEAGTDAARSGCPGLR